MKFCSITSILWKQIINKITFNVRLNKIVPKRVGTFIAQANTRELFVYLQSAKTTSSLTLNTTDFSSSHKFRSSTTPHDLKTAPVLHFHISAELCWSSLDRSRPSAFTTYLFGTNSELTARSVLPCTQSWCKSLGPPLVCDPLTDSVRWMGSILCHRRQLGPPRRRLATFGHAFSLTCRIDCLWRPVPRLNSTGRDRWICLHGDGRCSGTCRSGKIARLLKSQGGERTSVQVDLIGPLVNGCLETWAQ